MPPTLPLSRVLLAALLACAACASPPPGADADTVDAPERDLSAPPMDSATGPYCGLFRCAQGELCCERTALCYAPSCASCCGDPVDAGPDAPSPRDAAPETALPDAAPPDAAPADASYDHAAPPSYALQPANTAALPVHGTPSGAPYTFQCPAGMVSVGIAGYADTSVNAIALRCCALMPDGTVNNSVMTLPIAGSRTGTFFQDRCPANNTVVGWDVSADTALRQVILQCALLTDQVRGLNGPTALTPHGTATVAPAPVRCPPGYVLTGLAGTGDAPLTSLRGTCTHVGG